MSPPNLLADRDSMVNQHEKVVNALKQELNTLQLKSLKGAEAEGSLMKVLKKSQEQLDVISLQSCYFLYLSLSELTAVQL